MNRKLQIVLTIACVIFFSVVSASNDEIPCQQTGSSLREPRSPDFVAKQTVVSIITPSGSLLIDCRYDNPRTRVSLLFTQALDKPFLDATNKNIVQFGQIFMLTEVDTNDDGYYMCARKDGHGKGRIAVEVFVMEEENIYSSLSNLKHAFEDQDIEESSNNDKASIDEPSVTDQEPDMMDLIQQQNITIHEPCHVPSIPQGHLTTQNDQVTSSFSETPGHVKSSTPDNLTTQYESGDMRSSHDGTPCHEPLFVQGQMYTPNVLSHVTSSRDDTRDHVSSISHDQSQLTTITNTTSSPVSTITQIVLDHVTAVAKQTSSHVSSISSFVIECVRTTSAVFTETIAAFLNTNSYW